MGTLTIRDVIGMYVRRECMSWDVTRDGKWLTRDVTVRDVIVRGRHLVDVTARGRDSEGT